MLPVGIEQCRPEIQAEIEKLGAFLVDVEWRRFSGREVITFLVDKEGGITLEDCVAINRHLSDLLDAKGLMNASYYLEVSSPGLDRPLKTTQDFARAIGKKIRILVKGANGVVQAVVGAVTQADDEAIQLSSRPEAPAVRYVIREIIKARYEIDFGKHR